MFWASFYPVVLKINARKVSNETKVKCVSFQGYLCFQLELYLTVNGLLLIIGIKWGLERESLQAWAEVGTSTTSAPTGALSG